MAAGDINTYGAIRSMTGEGKAAYASQIYDEAQGKFQDQINQETANEGLVSAKVAQTFTDAEKEQARTNIGAPAQATTYNKTQVDNLVQMLRGFGKSSGAITYQGGTDPVFYCGRFSLSVHGDDMMKKFNEELDKLHSPNHTDAVDTYTCEAAEQELQGTRPVPIGVCHINFNGSHIWFISNVDGYGADKWTQVFFNAKVGTYTDGGVTKKGILNGQNIVIRNRVKANDSDEKYTLWGDFYELPYNLQDLLTQDIESLRTWASELFAKKDGFYEQMTVGSALALAGQTQRTNDAMYRKSGGSEEITTGTATIANIKGQTVAWNQLLAEGKLVDMGLPSGTLWATCNIDITQPDGFAASPFQYECSFFSWGNIDGHNPISTSTFDYDWGGVNAEAPYYEGQPYGETQGSTLTGNIPVGDTYDAARVNVGSIWCMPTRVQYTELFENTIYINADGTEVDASNADKRVRVNGILGIYLESKNNGNRLFFSCSGRGQNTRLYYRDFAGNYWQSTYYSARNARYMGFDSSNVLPQYYNNRSYGFPVRPVINKSDLIGDGKDGHKFALSSNNANITDVTLTYGSNSEPSTVALFEADYEKWFGKPLTYEEYDEGSLRSVQLDALKTVGFNQYNNGSAKVIGGLKYQITGTYTSITLGEETITPDANGLFTPSTSGTLTIAGGGSDTCVHISGDRNGEYEPYEEHVAPLPVTTLKGKLNGQGESVTIFPDGMKSAGSIYDEIYTVGDKTYAVQRVGSVDLGSLGWTMRANGCFASNEALNNLDNYHLDNSCCAKYTKGIRGSYTVLDESAKNLDYNYVTNSKLYIKDESYNDAASFKAANNGVMLYYRLAKPLVYEVEGFTLPKTYLVDGGGTEEQVQKSGVQGLAAILTCIYGVDAVGILDKLPRNYISEASMDNFLAKLNIATGGTWTKSFNESSGEWDFNYTPAANTNANTNEESI